MQRFSYKNLPAWWENRGQICASISRRHSILKIILKTKDEDELLGRWLDWHAAICGIENIIVFDNGSSSEVVADVYDKYRNKLEVFRFRGFLDEIHNTVLYDDLYRSIRSSCDFFIFLDTDEFLILLEQDRHYADERLISFLNESPTTGVFPATWIFNCQGSWRRFVIGEDVGHLIDGMRWGKPLYRSSVPFAKELSLHNNDVDRNAVREAKNCLFLLHMTNLFPERRIRANIAKLKSHGAIAQCATLEDALRVEGSVLRQDNVGRYFRELHELASIVGRRSDEPEYLEWGIIDLSPDGTVYHASPLQRDNFKAFLENCDLFSTLSVV